MKGMATMILATCHTVNYIWTGRNHKKQKEFTGDATTLDFSEGIAFCNCQVPYGVLESLLVGYLYAVLAPVKSGVSTLGRS